MHMWLNILLMENMQVVPFTTLEQTSVLDMVAAIENVTQIVHISS